MGLLEKLGVRDDPSAKLSEWLGGRLARLASDTKSGEVETMQPLLSEIDERIAGFVRDHGTPALESAIDQWWTAPASRMSSLRQGSSGSGERCGRRCESPL